MNESEKSKHIRSETEFPRRQFMSAAFLTGFGLVSGAKINAAPRDENQEADMLPTPGDALVDYMEFLFGVEGEILRPYYRVIGGISTELGFEYSKLKTLTKEFQDLVPELNADADLSRFRNTAEIGKATAVYISKISDVSGSGLMKDHANFVKLNAVDLEKMAADLQRNNDSIVLSSAAVVKLREILEMIARLGKITTKISDASKALTDVSNALRGKVWGISTLLRDAARILFSAEVIEHPPSAAAAAAAIKRLGAKGEPTSVGELRDLAARKTAEASSGLKELNAYQVPDNLRMYLPSDFNASADKNSEAIPITVLADLLDGVEGWIRRGDLLPKQQSNSRTDGEVRFVSANFVQPAGIVSLWWKISDILATHIPYSTRRRVGELYWQKITVSIYGVAKQEGTFFNLLPRMSDPSEVSLYQDQELRRRVARMLAEL